MTFKRCTIVVKNKGQTTIHTALRGVHRVTLLETRVTDDATGALLNPVDLKHSADRDTLTFKTFYEGKED